MFLSPPRRRTNQIAINGSLGSGKSTVGKEVSRLKGWEYYSTGVVQRSLAQAMGLSTLELNKIAETDPSIDERIDSIFKSMEATDGVVIDSRMAWHFLPNSFHVRLIVSPEEAADRILRDESRDAEKYSSSLVAAQDIEARAASERARYKNTYNVDVADIGNYDLIVDTEFMPATRIAELVVAAHTIWSNHLQGPSALISPKSAIPSNSIRNLDTVEVADYQEAFARVGVALGQSPKVLYFRGRHIILERHEYFCAAVRAGVPSVPVSLVDDIATIMVRKLTNEQFVRDSLSKSLMYDWEDACGMRYPSYPSWVSL